jgi:hypothetical protein
MFVHFCIFIKFYFPREAWLQTGNVAGEMHAHLWWENLNGKGRLEDLGVDGRMLKSVPYGSVGRGMWHARERGETCTGFWWESPKEKDHLEDQGVDGRMGSKWTLGRLVGGGGVEWIHLAQDRDRWRAVVSAVMNLRVLAPRS